MSPQAHRWLPDCALEDRRTAQPVARALSDWSDAWLAKGRLGIMSDWKRHDGKPNAPGYTEYHAGAPYGLLLNENAQDWLAESLLGRNIAERDLRLVADRALIDELVGRALDDLAEILAKALHAQNSGKADNAGLADRFVLPVGCGDHRPVLRIEACRSLLVDLAAGWAGPQRNSQPLQGPQKAVEAQQIHLSARLGRSRLKLADIEALGVGDVLLLDQPADAPLDACIDGREACERALLIQPGNEPLKLMIEKAPARW